MAVEGCDGSFAADGVKPPQAVATSTTKRNQSAVLASLGLLWISGMLGVLFILLLTVSSLEVYHQSD